MIDIREWYHQMLRAELARARQDRARDSVRIWALLRAQAWTWAALAVCWAALGWTLWGRTLPTWALVAAVAVIAVAGWRSRAACRRR